MNNFEKINAEFFNNSCDKNKNSSWRACCYLDEFMQDVYYYSICKNINKKFDSVLDIGCGQADFLNFIKRNTSNTIEYVGIDVSEKMIKECNLKFPKNNFYNCSFLDYDNKLFDIIVAIGTFNLRVSKEYNEQMNYIKSNIEKMYNNCKKSCSFTLMSKHGNENIESELFYYEPWTIFEYCLGLTYSVIVDHSSIPIDFIVTLHKD